MCADCVHAAHGFEPGMGDGFDFAPGVCSGCGRGDVIVFEIVAA